MKKGEGRMLSDKENNGLRLHIDYNHCYAPDDGRALHEDDFWTHFIQIPFSIFYPVQWMKPVYQSDTADIDGICENVVDINSRLLDWHFDEPDGLRSDWADMNKDCDQCYDSTVEHCDRLYKEMLERIKKSVLALLWSLKIMGMDRDRRILIARAVWSTRGNMDWIKVNPSQNLLMPEQT